MSSYGCARDPACGGGRLRESLLQPGASEAYSHEALFATAGVGLLCAIAAVAGACLLLSRLYVPRDITGDIPELFILPPNAFQPEHLESAQYMAALLVFPSVLAVVTWLTHRLQIRMLGPRGRKALAYVVYAAMAMGCCVLLYAISLLVARGGWFLRVWRTLWIPSLWIAIPGILIFIGLTIACTRDFLSRRVRSGLTGSAPAAACVVAALGAQFLYHSFGMINHIDDPFKPWMNIPFNAVFHAMVQVYQGKGILVDLGHQYGLYPHFLEPIFRVTGLSTLKYALVMSGLACTAYYLIYRFTRESSGNRVLALGVLASLVLRPHLCSLMVQRPGVLNIDPSFQYDPVRILFPSAAIYVAWRYFRSRSVAPYRILLVLGCAGVLWNPDTGLPTFLASLMALSFHELHVQPFRRALRPIALHWGKGILGLTLALLAFTLYSRLRYGAFPDMPSLLEYSRIFYLYGFYMLPMPFPGFWLVPVAAYAVGLMVACRAWISGKNNPQTSMIFMLSILGCGLFSYYQGRSHDSCLVAAGYPAAILAALYAANLFQEIRDKKRMDPLRALLAIVLTAGLGLAAVDTAVLLPRLYGWTAQEVVAARTEANARRSARVKFLSRNLSPGGEALILSFISGVCHLESRTASPVRAPGYVELFLRKDWNRISAWLLEPGGSKRLVVDAYILKGGSIFADGVASELLVTLKGWRIREVSPDGRLAVLEPKEVSGPDA